MNPVDQALMHRHKFMGAWLSSDPQAILAAHPPGDARWLIWQYGAAGLMTNDWRVADPWLEVCLDLGQDKENASDPLWIAEVLSALAELSLKDAGYFDAIRRGRDALRAWWSVLLGVPETSGEEPEFDATAFAEAYISGQINQVGQSRNGLVLGHGSAALLRAHARSRLLDSMCTALQAMAAAQVQDEDLVTLSMSVLAEVEAELSRSELWNAYTALGDAASGFGATEDSLTWFNRAVDLYYQNVKNTSEHYLLVQALFNKAGGCARLGQYETALDIYRMIAGDFELLGHYEGELRIDYAIAFTRFKAGDIDGVEHELRRIVAAYYRLREEAWRTHREFDDRNLLVVYRLLLSVIASMPSTPERFLEGLAIASRADGPSVEIVERHRAMESGVFDNWRDVGEIELITSAMKSEPESIVLVLESAVDQLVLFSLQGGSAPLATRCLVSTMSAEFTEGFSRFFIAAEEENDRIAEHRKEPWDAPTEGFWERSRTVWHLLPTEVRDRILSARRLYVVLSPFGNVDEFPIELVATEGGYLGLTHEIVRANSIAELASWVGRDTPRRRVGSRALIFAPSDYGEMGALDHAQEEARRVVRYAELLNLKVEAPTTRTPEELIGDLGSGCWLFHYVGHGSANLLGERLLLSQDRWLPPNWLRQLDPLTVPICFLSACEMGRARLGSRESRGFTVELLRAGAPAVIAALRPVSDRASAEIVRGIYAASRTGGPLSAALKQARVAAAENGLNPLCWSAYVVYGSWSATLKPIEPPPAQLSWSQLLVRYMASGVAEFKEAVPQALHQDERLPSAIGEAVESVIDHLDSVTETDNTEAESCLSQLAAIDLVAALRLRSCLSAWRTDRLLSAEDLDGTRLLHESGTGLTIALTLGDAFLLVGLARRHYPLLGLINLDEVMVILRHAVSLARALYEDDSRFEAAAADLTDASAMFDGKEIIDLTKILPRDMPD